MGDLADHFVDGDGILEFDGDGEGVRALPQFSKCPTGPRQARQILFGCDQTQSGSVGMGNQPLCLCFGETVVIGEGHGLADRRLDRGQ